MSSERRRKYHRRLRGGCQSCRDRHIRCDQSKPYWYVEMFYLSPSLSRVMLMVYSHNCLRYGVECGNDQGYPNEDIVLPNNPADSSAPLTVATLSNPFQPQQEPSQRFDPVLGTGMYDPFNTLPIELLHDSRTLFHHCKHITSFA